MSELSDMQVPGLPFPLACEGQPPCQSSVEDGRLVLTGGPMTDLFADPAGGGSLPDAGRLLGTPPDGDFALAARVTVKFVSSYDAGVLLIYASARQWAKLCLELSPQGRPTVVTVVTRGSSDDCNSFEVTGESAWLRITRTGRAWAFHASADGQWWRLVRYFALDGQSSGGRGSDGGSAHGTGERIRVGFLAQSPGGQGCTAVFDHITLLRGAPADLRDGS